jgi:hypothetical protein
VSRIPGSEGRFLISEKISCVMRHRNPSLAVKRFQAILKYFSPSGMVKRTVQFVLTRHSVPSMGRFKLIVTVEGCERVTFGLAVPRIRFLFTTVYCSSRFNFLPCPKPRSRSYVNYVAITITKESVVHKTRQ